MLNHDNQELCWEVLTKYGIRNQRMMVIEECSELQKAICKEYRNEKTNDDFLEELVDVIVMCQQMLLADGISMDVVNKLANKKLNRALEG